MLRIVEEVQVFAVESATAAFSDAYNATLSYAVNGRCAVQTIASGALMQDAEIGSGC